MKRYTLLRVTAIILEAIGYLILVGGLVLAIMIFASSYSVLPAQYRMLPSALLGTLSLVIWIFTFGHFLIIAHVIQVCLRSYDNSEQILDYLKMEKIVTNDDHIVKEETPLSKWLCNPPYYRTGANLTT